MNKILKRLTRGKKTLVAAIACATIIVQTIIPIFDISSIWAADIIVNPPETIEDTPIQDAIDSATDGDTIIINEGVYDTEQIIVNILTGETLTIEGNGEVKIQFPSGELNSSLEGSTNRVDANLTVKGGGKVTIKNITFDYEGKPVSDSLSTFYPSVFVQENSTTIIRNSVFKGKANETKRYIPILVGLKYAEADTSGKAIIEDNVINNYGEFGIGAYNSETEVEIKDNQITGTGSKYQSGIRVFSNAIATIETNTITNNIINDESSCGIAIKEAQNVIIAATNTITNNDRGVCIVDNQSTTILQNNTIRENHFGVTINESSNNNGITINNNEIVDNYVGLKYSETDEINQIDATNNYWGACNGPLDIDDHGSNPALNLEGDGNPVIGAVDYTGYDQVEQCQTSIEPPTEIQFIVNYDDPENAETLECGAYTDEEEVRVQWNEVENAVEYHYEVTYVDPETGEETVWPNPDGNPKVVKNTYYDGSFAPKGEGLRKIRVRAVDANGNLSNWSDYCNIYYTEGPVLTDPNLILTINGQEYTCGSTISTPSTVTVSWTEAENANDYRYAINVTDPEDWYTTTELNFTHEITEVKSYTYYVEARNEVGTTSYTPCTLTYDPEAEDNTDPIVVINSLTQNQNGTELNIEATATDLQSNITSMSYSIENTGISGSLDPKDGDFNELVEIGTGEEIDISSLTSGQTYNLAVCATDSAGNTGCTTTELTVNTPPVQDNQAPIITQKDIYQLYTELYVEATAEDKENSIKVIEYQLLEGWKSENQGSNEIKSGELDTTITGTYNQDNVVQAYRYIDVSDVEDGKYTVRICATDIKDNKGSGNHDGIPTITDNECYYEEGEIDTQAPTIVTNLQSKTLKEGENLEEKVTARDENSVGLLYMLTDSNGNTVIADVLIPDENPDGTYPEQYTWTLGELLGMDKLDTSIIEEGEYTLTYYFFDQAGNTTDDQIIEYTVENVKPSVNFKSNYTRVYEYATINFSGSFTDPSSIAENPDDAEWYYTVNYGDGNKYSKSGIKNPGNITIPSNKYTTAGTYTAKLTVCEAKPSDNSMSENQCGTDTITIRVYKYTQPSEPSNPEQTEKAVLEGYVYEDKNTDQIREEEEYGVEGIEVSIKQDSKEEIIAITDGNGYWKAEVPEGEAIIEVNSLTLPEDATLLSQAKTIEIELGRENIAEFAYTLEDGDVQGEKTCAISEMGTISGYIYNDSNKNNSKDDEEKGVEGIEVIIYVREDGEERIIETVSTDSEGYWEVSVCPGTYRMRVDEESLPDNAKMEKPENTTVISSNQNREINFSYQVQENWFKQNCIWIGLGVLIIVLVFMLGAIVLKNSEQANADQTEY